MDLFCDKCNPGPLTVSRILAFPTVVHLSQMTCNNDLSKLAQYNLMIRLTEELRSEDYSQFIQLPFQLLYQLLEVPFSWFRQISPFTPLMLQDDNFYCSEFQLFCAIQHWIQSNKLEISKSFFNSSDIISSESETADQIKVQADKLISLIRFPVMSADELYDVESSAASSGHFTPTLLQKLLHQALRYMVYR